MYCVPWTAPWEYGQLIAAMSSWKDKVCAVTGGSAGLGLAIGRALVERGARVVLIARGAEQLETAATELRGAGRYVYTIAADVAWQEDVERLAATIGEQFGRLDLVCNCAGRSARGPLLDTSPEDFQQLLEVNFFATVRTTRALAPLLIASRGHIVNIGSLASKAAPRFLGGYPASKFAQAAYTQQLRLELADQGVHVMLVCPGPIARDDAGQRYAASASTMPAAARQPGGGARVKALDPHDLAARVLSACERRSPELVLPAKARLLFAISQLSARWGDWLLRKQTSG
jgi:short-subunit dehydrogenase